MDPEMNFSQLMYVESHPIAKSFNSVLLEQGGWPLFVLFYGGFFILLWCGIYLTLKYAAKWEGKL